jgi:hypothetical protein
VIRLTRTFDRLVLTCHAPDGALRWRQRWHPEDFLSAPSQTVEVRDGLVLVNEGGQRLTVLRTDTGHRRMRLRHDDLATTTPYVLDGHVALLGPLGLDTTVTVVSADGRGSRTLTLASRVRWAAPLGAQLLVATQDGEARLLPEDRRVDLPPALTQSRQAPQVTTHGLQLGDRLWRWATR